MSIGKSGLSGLVGFALIACVSATARAGSPDAVRVPAAGEAASLPSLKEPSVVTPLALPSPAASPLPPEQKTPVRSKVSVEFFGQVKLDMAYSSNPGISPGDFANYVKPSTGGHDEFLMTANQTWFGFQMIGPSAGEMTSKARFDLDFYSLIGAPNKPVPNLRRAYVLLAWKELDMSVIGGMIFDVISPLTPATLDFGALRNAGNLGYRRPGIQFQKAVTFGKTRLDFQTGLSRMLANGNTSTDGVSWANDSAQPTVEARVAIGRPLLTAEKAEIGVSGHFGKERYITSVATETPKLDEVFESHSRGIDLVFPVFGTFVLKGEYFIGRDLNSYFGGIGQGVNRIKHTGIRAQGGWGQGSYTLDKWRLNAGYGFDDAREDDLSTGDRGFNDTAFANAIYSLTPELSVGFEVSTWRTEYVGQDSPRSNRYQAALMYSF